MNSKILFAQKLPFRVVATLQTTIYRHKYIEWDTDILNPSRVRSLEPNDEDIDKDKQSARLGCDALHALS